MDSQNTLEMAAALRQAADSLAAGPIDGTARREILRAIEPVRTFLLSMGFDEGSSRRRVLSFLRSVALANGIVGQRTAHRLCIRTFEEDADGAMKWLQERNLLEDQGSEGYAITEQGMDYLEEHKAEFQPPPEARRRPHAPRARRSTEPAAVAVLEPAESES
ncbi:MAG: hypothetical protein KGR26_03850 [Cyanobacteria bacterium REEB65]|nr:hypothetical protein [Cyanobacteria bacterium REEB65]